MMALYLAPEITSSREKIDFSFHEKKNKHKRPADTVQIEYRKYSIFIATDAGYSVPRNKYKFR